MGKQHQNVIVINGKKYNAVSGKMLDSSGSSAQTLDGVAKKKPSSSGVPTTRSTALHAKKPPQKSKTLMRSAVHKPAPTQTRKSKPTQVAGISKPALGTSNKRQKLAQQTKQSSMISHFNSSQVEKSSVVKKVQPMPVKPHTASVKKTKPHATKTSTQPTTHQKSAAASSSMIDKALANATAHENEAPKKERKHKKVARKLGISSRAMGISATILAGVLLGGFFAVQNVPNLSMRVAAARAGFNATLPGYNPSGFSFSGPINYSPGEVKISFSSNTYDNRKYDLTQRASNWNSDALLSNYVVTSSENYQTFLDRGRTLYIYGDANATWVDGGVWYQIEGDSQLTTDQLVRIASSL